MSEKLNSIQGVGIGLRNQHFQYIVENRPSISWFEVLSDNFLAEDGASIDSLQEIQRHYSMVLHSVGMSIGSTDPLNKDYFKKYKKLINAINSPFVSDHLSWISIDNRYFHELLPLPYTKKIAYYVADRIRRIQDLINCPLIVENISSYLTYKESEMPEWEFINLVTDRADCGILLDINNIYVNSINHQFEAIDYINAMESHRIKQFHLAGYTDCGTHLVDTHSSKVSDSVWKLCKYALKKFGSIPILIEWDAEIPTFPILVEETKRAEKLINM